MKISNWFILGLTLLFFALSFQTFQDAKPENRSDRIYKEIRKYSPYYLEKRIGGFRIMMKGSSQKEQPPIAEVFHRLDQLDKGWGQKHFKIKDQLLIIKNDKDKEVVQIPFKSKEEIQWVKKFYMLEGKQ